MSLPTPHLKRSPPRALAFSRLVWLCLGCERVDI